MMFNYPPNQAFIEMSRSSSRSPIGFVVIDGVDYKDDEEGRLDKFEFEFLSDTFVGGFSAKCLIVELDIRGIEQAVFIGKEVESFVGFADVGFIPIGKFVVDEVETDDLQRTVKLTCYDSAIKFDALYESTITYPCTFRQFIEDICLSVGVELDTKSLIFDNEILNSKPNMGDVISYREIISQYAQANVCMAYISRDDKLTFADVFDDPHSNLEIDGYDYDSIKIENSEGPINAVNLARMPQNDFVYDEDEASILQFGVTQLKLSNNIFLDDRRESVVSTLLNKVLGFVYRPFDIDYFALPQIDPGDLVSIYDVDDSSHPSPVCNIKYTYAGSLLGNISTKMLPETIERYEIPNVREQLKSVEIKVDKVEGEISLLASEIENLEIPDFSEIEQNIQDIETDLGTISNVVHGYVVNESGLTLTPAGIVTEVTSSETYIQDLGSKLDEGSLVNYATKTQTSTMISQQVGSSLNAYQETVEGRFNEFRNEVTTEFQQTNSSFNFQFSQLLQSISDLDDETREQFEEIIKYIRFVDGNIVLGEVGNQLTLNISNDRISFFQGASEVAYFSNNKMYVTDGEFINELRIGSFGFIPRSNGSLDFKKVG